MTSLSNLSPGERDVAKIVSALRQVIQCLNTGTLGNPLTPIAGGPVLSINKNATATPVPFLGIASAASLVAHLIGSDTNNATIAIQSFGTGSGPGISYLSARGTQAAPTASQSSDLLGQNYAFGYGATGYVSNAGAGFKMLATEAYSDTAGGAKIAVFTTPSGTATSVVAATFQASGGVSVGTTTDAGLGSLVANGIVATKGYTVATLPATAATGKITGAMAYVTDALAPAFLAAVVGGGAVVTPVFYNGTNWIGA